MIYEYIWIDGYGNLRSKTKCGFLGNNLQDMPIWNFDGSSTNQASGNDSEIILKPIRMVKDPFRTGENYLVLCETYLPSGVPTSSNNRTQAMIIFDKYASEVPMYGLEQEFFIMSHGTPNYFLKTSESNVSPQKDYYCGVGGDNIIDRHIVEECLNNCLYAELGITGMNAEVAPSQWELQICGIGVEVADGLVLLRYIVNRTLEKYNLQMDITPKPIKGDWNGSGCHVNFSTKKMREQGGYKYILESINKLEKCHNESMKYYGVNNSERLTGLHETSSFENFSYGVADRGASIRIPRDTEKNNCGYFEDRRPGSNIDPYLVCSHILDVCMT